MVISTPFPLSKLTRFLLKARAHGYVSNAQIIQQPQRPAFREFPPFTEEDFEYVDSYAGYYYASGQEVVRFRGRPIWILSYNGGMLPGFHNDAEFIRKTFSFLQKTLLQVETGRPFRGPKKFIEQEYVYTDESEGDMTRFTGTERIYYKKKLVFLQDYIGGLILENK